MADSKTEGNPYASPTVPAASSGGFKIVRWVLFCLAVILVFLSLPVAWYTLELANQEYLHIWNARRAITAIEINGSPVSIGAAIRYGAITVLVLWCLAAVLMTASRHMAKKSKRHHTRNA